MAITQLVPRILEQSIFEHFHCNLNGKDRLVRFTYVEFNISSLSIPLSLSGTGKLVHIIKDGKIILTSASIQELLPLLDILSSRTISKYINHVLPINSPLLGPVNLLIKGYQKPLISSAIIHRTSNDHLLSDLFIPGLFSDTDLLIGPVYVYDTEKILYRTYDSIAKAAKRFKIVPVNKL